MHASDDLLENFAQEHPRVAQTLRGSRYLGSGEFGSVVRYNNQAIKITRSLQDAKVSRVILGRNLPSVVRVHAVTRVGKYNMIRQELLYELSTETHYALRFLCEGMLYLRAHQVADPDRIVESAEWLHDTRHYKDALPGIRRMTRLAEQLSAAVLALREVGVYHLDLHEGNVLQTRGGAIKVIDFGRTRCMPRHGKPRPRTT